MKKHHAVRTLRLYVGFLDGRPHVQENLGSRVIEAYVSQAAARRAYADVRTAHVVFDADTSKRTA